MKKRKSFKKFSKDWKKSPKYFRKSHRSFENNNIESNLSPMERKFVKNQCTVYSPYDMCKYKCEGLHLNFNISQIRKWFNNYDEIVDYEKSHRKFDKNNYDLMISGSIKQSIRPNFGATAIPYCIDFDNEFYILLGYQQERKGYQFFGGKEDSRYDENFFQTGLRKFNEDTYGVFEECFDIKQSYEKMKRIFHQKIYNLVPNPELDLPFEKDVLKAHYMNKYGKPSNYVVFLLPLPYKYQLYSREMFKKAKKTYEKRMKDGEKDIIFRTFDYQWVKWEDFKEKYKQKDFKIVGKVFGIESALHPWGHLVLDIMRDEIEKIYQKYLPNRKR